MWKMGRQWRGEGRSASSATRCKAIWGTVSRRGCGTTSGARRSERIASKIVANEMTMLMKMNAAFESAAAIPSRRRVSYAVVEVYDDHFATAFP
jgi:hypothetical protein